jgi:hypothetical protein
MVGFDDRGDGLGLGLERPEETLVATAGGTEVTE